MSLEGDPLDYALHLYRVIKVFTSESGSVRKIADALDQYAALLHARADLLLDWPKSEIALDLEDEESMLPFELMMDVGRVKRAKETAEANADLIKKWHNKFIPMMTALGFPQAEDATPPPDGFLADHEQLRVHAIVARRGAVSLRSKLGILENAARRRRKSSRGAGRLPNLAMRTLVMMMDAVGGGVTETARRLHAAGILPPATRADNAEPDDPIERWTRILSMALSRRRARQGDLNRRPPSQNR
jgi:hypothetical protein